MFERIARTFEGTTAVVIGAGGIGAEIVRQLGGNVARLVVADQNDQLLSSLLSQHGASKLFVHNLDVGDASAVATFFAELDATVGSPDLLFYTAGILNIESLAEMSAEKWQKTVQVNLNGAYFCVQAAADRMKKQKRGSIIVLGSIAGTKARSGSRVNPVYNATKAGLAAFVNGAAMQFRPHGIRINCISPGPTATQMMNLQPAQVHAAVSEMTLDGRMNDPAEVAELALFIAGHGRFTGEEICMGGGAGLGG
ncbi:SDR family NAD(P)-dependent oxidoreductase [Schlesneria sp.]|uniref:SDR family NAD(P)-dependent oxidoreductase n=1 Tax=Schlesneria sp. TaxID=2762018 RepID=UPI002EFCEC40